MYQIGVRLYRLHDADLMYLQKNMNVPMYSVMKQILCSYVRGKVYKLKIPIADKLEPLTKSKSQIHIRFDEEKDKDVIAFMENIKPRCKCAFMKNLTRSYLVTQAVYAYFNDNKPYDDEFFILRNTSLNELCPDALDVTIKTSKNKKDKEKKNSKQTNKQSSEPNNKQNNKQNNKLNNKPNKNETQKAESKDIKEKQKVENETITNEKSDNRVIEKDIEPIKLKAISPEEDIKMSEPIDLVDAMKSMMEEF